MAFKKKFPNRKETEGAPYAGIVNLRPETKVFLKNYELRLQLLKQ